jgi:hypothetical protein
MKEYALMKQNPSHLKTLKPDWAEPVASGQRR